MGDVGVPYSETGDCSLLFPGDVFGKKPSEGGYFDLVQFC